jgi:tRNA(adenine34) deaminase
MCAGALLLARIDAVWYGPREPKFGACGSRIDLPSMAGLNHHLQAIGGILEEESASLMRAFFQTRRRNGREDEGGEITPNR